MEELKPYKDKPKDPKLALEITNATFAWDREQAAIPDDKKGVELKEKEVQPKQKGEGPLREGGNKEMGMNSDESGADELKNRNSAEGEAEASVPLLEKEDIVKTLFDVDLTVKKVRLGRYIKAQR